MPTGSEKNLSGPGVSGDRVRITYWHAETPTVRVCSTAAGGCDSLRPRETSPLPVHEVVRAQGDRLSGLTHLKLCILFMYLFLGSGRVVVDAAIRLRRRVYR